MFKVNQLVRSKDTGRFYTVFTGYSKHPMCQTLDGKQRMRIFASALEIIGNNYQAKQKCSR